MKPNASLADYVWLRMSGLYGHRWTSSYGDNSRAAAGQEWALTLADLSRQQIDAGLNACRGSGEGWPPTAPEFRARCFGIPSINHVRADMGTRKMPFTRLVWQGIDAWLFSNSNQRDAERMFQNAYSYAVARRMDGAELPPEPAGELTHEKKQHVRASPETAAKHCDEIRAILGMNDNPEDESCTQSEPSDE